MELTREVCYLCGQDRQASVHGKSYGSGGWWIDKEGNVKSYHSEPYKAPWQHYYVPATLTAK